MNPKIILIPNRGLCFHNDWPVEPNLDDYLWHPSGENLALSMDRKKYQDALSKAIEEAVPFSDSEDVFKARLKGTETWGMNPNHPYPVPENYKVELEGRISKHKGDLRKAYLIPIEQKPVESQEELWREAVDESHKKTIANNRDVEMLIKRLKEKFTIQRK